VRLRCRRILRLRQEGQSTGLIPSTFPICFRGTSPVYFFSLRGELKGFSLRAPQVLSALQFEKHAGAVSKNQNGHIFLRNGKSLYELFHAIRPVPAAAFPEEFRAAAGVPMTVHAAGASPAPGQGQHPGGMGSWEPNGVQMDGVMAESPSAPAQEDVEMLTEEEKAGLCLLGLR
jgi:hypothetical protein